MMFGTSSFKIATLIFGLAILGACQDSTQKPSSLEKKTSSTQNAKTTENTTSEANSESTKNKATDIVITQKETSVSLPPQKSNLKAVTPQQFSALAPIDITKRIDSLANTIFADEKFIYTDDGQDLILYSPDFKRIDSIAHSYPVLKINRVNRDNKTYIFAIEENNVLEIFELAIDPQTQAQTLLLTAGYDVGGVFSWLNPKTLLVFMENKIQFLDFGDLNSPQVLREIPIGGVHDKLILKNHLYLLRDEFLDVLNLDSYNLVASLRLGQKAQFLGATRDSGKNLLYVTFQNEERFTYGFQTLELSEDLSSVIDLGKIEKLPVYLKSVQANFNLGVILGLENHHLHVFHLKNKKQLRGPFDRDTDVLEFEIYDNTLYTIQKSGISSQVLALENDLIHTEQSPTQVESAKPALAQIGLTQTLKDEYTLTTNSALKFEKNSKAVFLLDHNHMIILKSEENGHHQIAVSENLSDDNYSIENLPSTSQIYQKTLLTPVGLFLNTSSGKVEFLDVNLKQPKPLNLEFKNLQSWAFFKQNEGYLLVALSQNPILYKEFNIKSPNKASWVIELFQINSPEQIQKVSQIPLETPGQIFALGYDIFALATQTEISFFSARDIFQPKKLDEDTKTYTLPGTLLDAKLSPKNDALYTYIQDASGTKSIYIFDYENSSQRHVTLDAKDVSLSQFQGSSFIKGGQMFVLPSQKGTLFFDLTVLNNQPQTELLKAEWPIASEWVDVANRGEFICVALNKNGVYCGQLLFY